MRILVTGATGFIGYRLCEQLVEAGHEVFGLVRTAKGAERLPDRVTPVPGDIVSEKRLVHAFEVAKPDAVAHLAARTALETDAALLQRTNVDGTRAVVAASKAAGVKRFVFMSTVVVGRPKGATLTEDQPLEPTTAYGRSKMEAEEIVLDELISEGISAAIIRPSHVYGPGGWYKSIVDDIRKRRFLIPGDGDNLWDVVHVDDVASATKLLLEADDESVSDAIFHVVDDEPVTMNQFIAETCVRIGRRLPRHVPAMAARLVRGSGPVDAAIRSAKSTNARLKDRLGWAPQFPTYRDGVTPVVTELTGR